MLRAIRVKLLLLSYVILSLTSSVKYFPLLVNKVAKFKIHLFSFFQFCAIFKILQNFGFDFLKAELIFSTVSHFGCIFRKVMYQ